MIIQSRRCQIKLSHLTLKYINLLFYYSFSAIRYFGTLVALTIAQFYNQRILSPPSPQIAYTNITDAEISPS